MAGKSWTLSLTDKARREIVKLPHARLVEEARETIDDLVDDPFPPDHVKMRKYAGMYRIVYRVEERRRKITIVRVRPRETAYQGMRNP